MRYLNLASAVAAVIVALCIGGSTAHANAIEVAPPAADETLIYMIRVGRITASGQGYWIGVNDKTVARLRNKKYAVIRAKAGTITLNLAIQGVAVVAAPVDDRPGETVYLTWRYGDRVITEVDAKEGKKILEKYKPMKPIKEEKPNNEEFLTLINMGRMGFDLMQPATQGFEADDEHAVITFFRHKEKDHLNLGIWSEDHFLGDLDGNRGLEVKVPAGEHYFLAGNVGTSVMRTEVEAGKRYLVWLDIGGMVYRVKLTPVENKGGDIFEEKLRKVEMVELNADRLTPGIREREAKMREYLAGVVARAKAGEADYTSLNAAHAF